MPTREAHAQWFGSVKEGEGRVDLGDGVCEAPYSFGSRFGDEPGTNPEELLGAAHAGCFSMALSLMLSTAGFAPEQIDTTAQVSIDQQDGGYRITRSHLICEASVPGIDQGTFTRYAEAAKASCPVSQALAGTDISLDAHLREAAAERPGA